MAIDLILAHRHSLRNQTAVRDSLTCGCFFCLRSFAAAEIIDWVDNGMTALCPRCQVDAVIGDASGIPIRPDVLGDLHRYWFG